MSADQRESQRKSRILKQATGRPVMVVGGIPKPHQADNLISSSTVDIVLLGRKMMRDSHWAFNAAKTPGAEARHVFAEQYGFFVGSN